MDTPGDELALLRRAIDGDSAALKLVLLDLHPRLCSYLTRRIPADLRPALDAEDVVQETYAQIFRRIRDFDLRGSASFQRWVYTIALHQFRHAISRGRAAKRGGGARALTPPRRSREESCVALLELLAGPGRTPSRCVARQEAVLAVEAALTELPEHYRQALWLIHIQGWTVAMAAAEMGRTERALHGLCRRGLKLLRDRLGSRSRYLSSSE